MTDVKQSRIEKKIFRIQQNIEPIPMNGYNSFSKYYYVLFSDVMKALKPHLLSEGLMLSFEVTTHTFHHLEKATACELIIEARLVDIENGNYYNVTVPAYSEDKGDKAVYQAISNGKKYALITLFALPIGEDVESSPKAHEKANATNNQPAKNKTTNKSSRIY